MPAFLFQKGGVDLSPGSRLGLGLGSGFAPCLEGMAGVTTWLLWQPLWEYKAQLPGRLQGRAADSRHCPVPPLPHLSTLSSTCPICLLAETSREVLMGLSFKPNKTEGALQEMQQAGGGAGTWTPVPNICPCLTAVTWGLQASQPWGPALPPRSLAWLVAEGRPARWLPSQESSGPTLLLPCPSADTGGSCPSQPRAPSLKGEQG